MNGQVIVYQPYHTQSILPYPAYLAPPYTTPLTLLYTNSALPCPTLPILCHLRIVTSLPYTDLPTLRRSTLPYLHNPSQPAYPSQTATLLCLSTIPYLHFTPSQDWRIATKRYHNPETAKTLIHIQCRAETAETFCFSLLILPPSWFEA